MPTANRIVPFPQRQNPPLTAHATVTIAVPLHSVSDATHRLENLLVAIQLALGTLGKAGEYGDDVVLDGVVSVLTAAATLLA